MPLPGSTKVLVDTSPDGAAAAGNSFSKPLLRMQLAHIPPRAGSPYAPHPNPHRTGAGTSIAAARPESFAKRTDRHLSPHCSIVLPFGSKGIPRAVAVAAVGALGVAPGAPWPVRARRRHDSARRIQRSQGRVKITSLLSQTEQTGRGPAGREQTPRDTRARHYKLQVLVLALLLAAALLFLLEGLLLLLELLGVEHVFP